MKSYIEALKSKLKLNFRKTTNKNKGIKLEKKKIDSKIFEST